MFEKLNEKNFDLLRVLFSLKQSLDIYRIIAVNAGQINVAGAGKSFFAYVQRLALESCVANICKLVEIEKEPYELNSIPGVIQHLQKEKIACQNTDFISILVRENGLQYKIGEEIAALESIFKHFYDRNAAELKRFKTFRDKRIAHVENVPEEKKGSLPSYEVMDEFLNFGSKFYSAIQQAYVGSFPVQLEDEKKVLTGLLHLLEIKGIKNIKNDFED